MKKLLLALVAVLFIAGTVYALEPGVIEQHGGAVFEPFRTYQLVRVLPGNMFSGATLRDPVLYEVSEGSVMVWLTGTSGADGVTVAPCSLVSLDSRVAGVLVTNVLISYESSGKDYTYASDDYRYDNWGYLQTYGKCYARVSSLVTAGDMLGCAAFVTGTAVAFNPNNMTGTKASTGAEHDPSRQGVLGFVLETQTATVAADDNFARIFIRVR